MSAPVLSLQPSELSPTPSMASESAFPLEIYEHILDFVTEDVEDERYVWKKTLANTSLVRHDWHPRSRALLFRVLRLGSATDGERLCRLRDHLRVAPHLADYVEEVRIVHRPESSRLLESFPRWLAVYLPRLKTIYVKLMTPIPLNMHRFFCLPSVRVQSVMTLEYNYIGLWETSELEGLLLPYPNVRILTLHQVGWIDRTHQWKGKGLPRPLRVSLALTDLRLMLNASGLRSIHLVNRLGYEYLLQACRGTLSKLLINIIPMRILILQFQDDHFLNVIEFPHLEVLNLEILMVPTLTTRFKDREDKSIIPYAEVISVIPRFLRRLSANQLRILRLTFASPDIDEAPNMFLEHLMAIREPLEELVLASYFPSLKTITFDLGHRARDIASWQSHITKCFPELVKAVCVQVIPHDPMIEYIRPDILRPGFYY